MTKEYHETGIHKAWQQRGLFIWMLLPLSVAYRAASFYLKYGVHPKSVGVPLVVVGNINVGGSGKTPITIALSKELVKQGWTPGIISRGYKGKAKEPLEVLPDSDPAIVGDEPIVIKREQEGPVFVCPNRVEAGLALLRKYPDIDIVISDDGLQHYKLARDVELAVVGPYSLGNRWLLPAGPLREPVKKLKEVDAIILTNGAQLLEEIDTPCLKATEVITHAVNLLNGESRDLTVFAKQGRKIAAVAGIAAPERFFEMLKAKNLDIEEYPLPDHYDYKENPFTKILADIIFITAKDAVKCAQNPSIVQDERIWVIPLETELDPKTVPLIEEKLKKIVVAYNKAPTNESTKTTKNGK
ncbi:MAG: tetraacyldisaccharide 4'-kinase [Burkholderiales bacterium]|nr:tetraacyldisaccharide 4'-kinase [Burkholderiales bacterium]